MFEGLPILSINIILPLFGALFIILTGWNKTSCKNASYANYISVVTAILTLVCSTYLLFKFDINDKNYQFVEKYDWIKNIDLEFFIGVDGLSIYFVFLTSFLTLICMIVSLYTVKKQVKEYLLCFLLLETFCLGAFLSLNLLLFYLFFEIILIPMYIIIGVWGGENKIYSAMKFFIYTFFGSMFFLASLFYIYSETATFNIIELSKLAPSFSGLSQTLLWFGIFVALAVKVPMPPFHSWLPDAHVQAPTAGSIMLAGVLLKLGTYGFLRILIPLFPKVSHEFSIYIVGLSVFAIIYSSLLALAQTDMKKMIAYSSIAHMGYVTAGIFSFTESGVSGAIFQMISHAVVSSSLFLIVGILYERNHTKMIDQYGGVANVMPNLAILFMISMLGSIGLPGTSGFIGEFLTLVGVFEANTICAVFASIGLIFGALYMLKLYKLVMLGKISEKAKMFDDLKSYELIALVPLIVFILYLGLMPGNLLDIINSQSHSLS